MKSKQFFLVLMFLGGFVACNNGKNEPKTQKNSLAQTVSVQLKVSGMTCESCSRSIKNTLAQHSSVKNIEIKVKEGSVRFDLAGKTDLTEQKIKKLIDDLGYKVESFSKKIRSV